MQYRCLFPWVNERKKTSYSATTRDGSCDVRTVSAPDKTTASLIEPLVVTHDDMQSPDRCTRRFPQDRRSAHGCHWLSVSKIASTQIASMSGKHVHLKRIMRLGYISPATSIRHSSTIQTGSAKSDSTHDELRTALKDSFRTPPSRPTNVHNYLIYVLSIRRHFRYRHKS